MITSKLFSERDQFHAMNSEALVGQIVIRPNNSLTWQAAIYILGTLAFISMAIAISFLLVGYWLILPFTLLELSVIAFCFYYCMVRSSTQEVLTFGLDKLVLEVGRHKVKERKVWPRFFTKIHVTPPANYGYRSIIKIQYQTKDDKELLEIGKWLTQKDKKLLISQINEMVQAANHSASKLN